MMYTAALFKAALITPYKLQVNQYTFFREGIMKKPTLSKKIVAAIVALLASVAASFGLYINQATQDSVTDVACDTVVECSE